jgi:hypothetical protein
LQTINRSLHWTLAIIMAAFAFPSTGQSQITQTVQCALNRITAEARRVPVHRNDPNDKSINMDGFDVRTILRNAGFTIQVASSYKFQSLPQLGFVPIGQDFAEAPRGSIVLYSGTLLWDVVVKVSDSVVYPGPRTPLNFPPRNIPIYGIFIPTEETATSIGCR